MSKINNTSTKRLCSWVGHIRARRSNCLSLLNEWKGIISWFLPNLSFSHIISVLKIVPHGLCVSRMCIWKSSCYNGLNPCAAASMYPPFCNSLSFFNAMFHFKRFLVLYPGFFITDFAELKMLVSHITIEENGECRLYHTIEVVYNKWDSTQLWSMKRVRSKHLDILGISEKTSAKKNSDHSNKKINLQSHSSYLVYPFQLLYKYFNWANENILTNHVCTVLQGEICAKSVFAFFAFSCRHCNHIQLCPHRHKIGHF